MAVLNLLPLDTQVCNQQKSDKERLLQKDGDVIDRKFLAPNSYYVKQIEIEREMHLMVDDKSIYLSNTLHLE